MTIQQGAARAGQRDISVFDDPHAVAHHAAAWLVEKLNTGTRDPKAVCLTGGLTPLLFYQTLAQRPYADAIPRSRVHWFWCDERWVPATHERSNFRMVWDTLLSKISVPSENVHPIRTHIATPLEAAELYEKELKAFYGADVLDAKRPLFDVTFLGMGTDGHTASLFPDSTVLHERTRWVRAVGEGGIDTRITLTYPALESSGDLAFLVTGAAKRGVLETVLSGSDELPVSRLRPVGRQYWFVDSAAAATR